jgi:hypothetical protein
MKEEKQVRYVCDDEDPKCESCSVNGKLMCSFNIKDTIFFILPVFGVWITWVLGLINGFLIGKYDLPFLIIFAVSFIGYLIFFFQVWENRVLCSHCPYYSFKDEKYVKCYANYGIHKAWKYNPAPMTTSEKIQFLIAVALFALPPLVLFAIFSLFLYFWISLTLTLVWLVSMHYLSCSKCPNFSCPLNNVPKTIVDEYLKHNSVMRTAWEEKGYKIE